MDKNYTVCCIGFQPEIAQFNGFKTLGGYKSTYPHSKCLEVRTILNNDQKICLSRLQIHQSDIEGVNFNPKKFLQNEIHYVISKQKLNQPKLRRIYNSKNFIIYSVIT